MTPIIFEGRFGWLHRPADADPPVRPLGVVLCPAFAQEEVCGHHGYMELAEALAAAGMPTIRFDHRGTGDSADAALTLATMAEDAARAAECLRQSCDVGAVALCGLRLGAAVAALAAARIPDVAALVMLAPVVSGQAFLRETRAAASVASLSTLDPVPKAGVDATLNTNGFAWSAEFQREVAGIDVAAALPDVPRMLMLTTRADRKAAALGAAMRARGAAVTEWPFADYETYIQDPTTNETPHASFAAVVDWLRAIPVTASAAGTGTGTGTATAGVRVALAETLVLDGIEEVPTRFGPGGAIFGILCRPIDGPAAPVAALLLHEGSTHHIGNGRAYVALARQLARAGIASLRMDLTGMGDSPSGGNDRSPHYDPERLSEAHAGMDRLVQAGFGKAVAFGLCSGAHTALRAAATDDRIVGAFIINLQKFVWHYGDDIRVAARNNKRTLLSYARSMRNAGEWRRALSGQADLIGIARVLGKRGIQRAVHAVRSLFPPASGSERAQIRDLMQAFARRRVHLLLIFSDEDPGLAEIAMHFGRGGRRLAAWRPARLVILPRADHHFNSHDARRRYFALVEEAMRAVIADHGAVARQAPVQRAREPAMAE